MPQVSVIVPAHNAAATIDSCLNALVNQDYPKADYEVIVVDDGSTDQTYRQANAKPAVCVVRQGHLGRAAARNAGIRRAQGEIVCFTDADCFPRPDWLTALVSGLREQQADGCKGIYASVQSALVARLVQIEYEDKYDRLYAEEQIDFIDTYSAAYRREVLTANDGFDERFQVAEDQELSFRLDSRGYKLVFVPQAVVEHLHSDTVVSYFIKKFWIGYWKAQLIRRFPERAVRDSHTPQTLKLQLILIMLLVTSALAMVLFSWARLVLLATSLAFLATTLPFAGKAWPKDRTVAVASPFLLLVRALALGAGYLWGTLKPQAQIRATNSNIGGLSFVFKRLLDLTGACVGLGFTLLLSPLIALAIRIDSPGPVLFGQERIGRGGQPFVIYKFRSMYADREKLPSPVSPPAEGSVLAVKPHDDPRVTRVGRWLRRWSLDELPQFWNVMRGEMSLVGPRPEEAHVVAKYNDWHRQRLAVKPGVTGPMQVNGRADLTLDERVLLELDYIERYSIWQDLAIIARTLPAVLKGKGAR